MRIAVIDIGSNSIKLAVADVSEVGFTILRREKEMVRLGAGTLAEGHLSPQSIARAIECIGTFRAISEDLGATRVLAFATAAVREANNSAQFCKEILRRTSVSVEVLSGVEEARLIGVAVSEALGHPNHAILNIDIGGGSTELTVMRAGHPLALHSMKLGAVRLTEQFLTSEVATPHELRALKEEIIGALERPVREMESLEWRTVTGTSGTILAIGEAMRGASSITSDEYTPGSERHILLGGLERFNARIAKMTVAERRKLPGITAQRAEIIVAGGQILENVMRALEIKRLHTCAWSLREGLIIDRLLGLPSVKQTEEAQFKTRLEGAELLGTRFNYEAQHGKQVADLSLRLFDDLATLHQLPQHYRPILAAGALLHDIGYAISHASHHKHSLYIILNSELTGFTDSEKLLIANIARYHRKALPKDAHTYYAQLSEPERRIIWLLGGIVRLADAMDRSHQSRLRDVRARHRSGTVFLSLDARRSPRHELWAMEQKKQMLETALGVAIRTAVKK